MFTSCLHHIWYPLCDPENSMAMNIRRFSEHPEGFSTKKGSPTGSISIMFSMGFTQQWTRPELGKIWVLWSVYPKLPPWLDLDSVPHLWILWWSIIFTTGDSPTWISIILVLILISPHYIYILYIIWYIIYNIYILYTIYYILYIIYYILYIIYYILYIIYYIFYIIYYILYII